MALPDRRATYAGVCRSVGPWLLVDLQSVVVFAALCISNLACTASLPSTLMTTPSLCCSVSSACRVYYQSLCIINVIVSCLKTS